MISIFGLEIDVSVFSAIIGVFGTIVGTIVGWILGKIKTGKLKFKIRIDYSSPYYSKNIGENTEELNGIDLKLSIAVQNTKDSILVIRNPRLLIYENKNRLCSVILKDLKNIKSFSGVFHYHGEFSTINVVGKEAIDMDASAFIPKSHTHNANRLYFCYTNEKFRDKKIFIEKVDYSKTSLVKKCNHSDEI